MTLRTTPFSYVCGSSGEAPLLSLERFAAGTSLRPGPGASSSSEAIGEPCSSSSAESVIFDFILLGGMAGGAPTTSWRGGGWRERPVPSLKIDSVCRNYFYFYFIFYFFIFLR
jgi:hypothetical protein